MFRCIVAALVLLATGVDAHSKLTSPTDRTTQSVNGNKLTPFADYLTVSETSCGGANNQDPGPGAVVASYNSSQVIEVVYDITISHPLAPGVRIAVRDPALVNSAFTDHILYDLTQSTADDVTSGSHTIQVTLPDINCTSCELQLLWASQVDGGFYLGCADIAISSGGNSPIVTQSPTGLSDSSISTNTVAAAVMLPLALVAMGGLFFVFRGKMAEKVGEQAAKTDTLLKALTATQAFSVILFIVLMASKGWANAGLEGVEFGLFKYCLAEQCFGLAKFDANAAAIAQAVQAFTVLAFLLNLVGALFSGLLTLGILLRKDDPKHTGAVAVVALLNTVFVFLGVCLYAAFYYDVIKQAFPDAKPGWAADLMGVYWVVSLGACLVAFRVYVATGGGVGASSSV